MLQRSNRLVRFLQCTQLLDRQSGALTARAPVDFTESATSPSPLAAFTMQLASARLLCLVMTLITCATATKPPNVVLFLADDLGVSHGYGDVVPEVRRAAKLFGQGRNGIDEDVVDWPRGSHVS